MDKQGYWKLLAFKELKRVCDVAGKIQVYLEATGTLRH